jgi:hypothetical protein
MLGRKIFDVLEIRRNLQNAVCSIVSLMFRKTVDCQASTVKKTRWQLMQMFLCKTSRHFWTRSRTVWGGFMVLFPVNLLCCESERNTLQAEHLSATFPLVPKWNFTYASPISKLKSYVSHGIRVKLHICLANIETEKSRIPWHQSETYRTHWSDISLNTSSQSEMSHRFTAFMWCFNFYFRLLCIVFYRQKV